MIPTGLAGPWEKRPSTNPGKIYCVMRAFQERLGICFGHVIYKKALENQARMSKGQLDVQEERCSGLEFKSDPWGLLTALIPGVNDIRTDEEVGSQRFPPERLLVWRLRRCNQEERSQDGKNDVFWLI